MEHTKIKMKCLFCFSDQFILDDSIKPKNGDLIQCANCGKLNDFDSLFRVVKRKGEEFAVKQANSMIKEFEKEMKKVFK